MISTELQRIIQAKADIVTSIENKGVTVPAGTKIDDLDDYVDQIQQGGPTREPDYFYIENESDNPNSIVNIQFLIAYQKSGIQTQYKTFRYDMEYSLDKVTWGKWYGGLTSLTLDLTKGQKVYLRGYGPVCYRVQSSSSGLDYEYAWLCINVGKQSDNVNYVPASIGGDISTLLDPNGTDYMSGDSCFYRLFDGTSVNSISTYYSNIGKIKSDFKLPNNLTFNCFYRMFYQTPITEIEGNIFSNCTFMSASASHACDGMFQNCTSLTSVSNDFSLPATSLAPYCYQYMFNGCTSLTSIPTNLLPATNLNATRDARYCYYYMFKGCTSLTNVPNLPATELAQFCYAAMFRDCTSLTSIPTNLLPATTLLSCQYCYQSMFYGCTSLTNVPNLPATTLANYCYYTMFYGCASLTSIPTNLLPATTLNMSCYYGMFQNCTGITTAPYLPALTLQSSVYTGMFNGCTSLNYIKAMFTTDISSSTSYTSNWLNNVAATGTFVKNANATWSRTDASGVPSGWTVETAAA